MTPPPSAPPSWSNLLKQPAKTLNPDESAATARQSVEFVGSCKSSKGIAVAVVDANPVISGGDKLFHSADRFVSIPEVINEIRDPSSRHSLNLLPFTVETLEPTPEALNKVIHFAKATGDLQTLSDVDLKLIALTYMLEAQIHGTQNIRESPPPIQTVNVKRLPEKDLPGWGSNVPNLEEWEALAQAAESGSQPQSRILPVKELNVSGNTADEQSMDSASNQDGSEGHIQNQENDYGFRGPRKFMPKKKEVKIEGKKMVADGIDASQGASDDNANEWRPAVCRSTHRRFLRRKARREMNAAASELGNHVSESNNVENGNVDDDQCPELVADGSCEEITDEKDRDKNLSASLIKMKLEEEANVAESTDFVHKVSYEESIEIPDDELGNFEIVGQVSESAGIDIPDDDDLGNFEIVGQVSESTDSTHLDDGSSEQSWTLRSLSESSVACVTTDFAMQNVLLQMGLRLLAPGGMQIRELHRWVLKCHACFKVTTETGRVFCPTCGNGGTLRKVAVTVNENGIVLVGRRPRISLRGTKYSLPMPQGGRDAVTKNPILREDQLPQKYLYPTIKRKNKQDDDLFIADNVFRSQGDKKAPLQPPIRKTLAVFSGKRNPNDNHYARSKA